MCGHKMFKERRKERLNVVRKLNILTIKRFFTLLNMFNTYKINVRMHLHQYHDTSKTKHNINFTARVLNNLHNICVFEVKDRYFYKLFTWKAL